MMTVNARRRCNELRRMLYPHSRRRVLVFLVVACSHKLTQAESQENEAASAKM